MERMNNTPKTDVIKRIQDYLLSGGVWNPELAIHDNVRDLIIDCRTEIERLQSERSELRKKCAEWIYNFRGLRTLTQQLDEEINDVLNEQDKLKDWKESALVEFNKIQTQEIGKEIGAVLGSSIHEQILPAIKKLKKQADAARDCLDLSRDNCVLLHKERDEAHSVLEQVTDRLEEATIKIIKLQSKLDSAKNAFSEILKINEDTPVLIYQKMEDIARNALKKYGDNI